MVNKDQQPARSSDQPIAAQTFQTSSVVDDFLAAIFSSNSRSTTATESNTLNSSTNNPDIPAHLSAIAKLAGSKRGREHQDDNDDDKKSEKRKNAAALPKANQSKTTVSSASSGNQRQPTSNDAGRVKQAAEEKRPQIDDLPPDCRLIVRHRSGSFREFDLRNRFSRYGQVLEVCLKSDFSFVQFPNPDICAAAVRGENGRLLNGQKLDLEVCRHKPHDRDRDTRRRTHRRNRRSRRDRNDRDSSNKDHNYDDNRASSEPYIGDYRMADDNMSTVDDERRYPYTKDRWRPYDERDSMPSARSYSRTHDYDGEPRYRIRETVDEFGRTVDHAAAVGDTPYRRDDHASSNKNARKNIEQQRGDHRRHPSGKDEPRSSRRHAASDSPRLRSSENASRGVLSPHRKNAELPLPRRYGKDVPVVQIIAMGDSDRGFVNYVETTIRVHAIPIHTLFIEEARISRESVIRQMIAEGVQAVIIIERGFEIQSLVYLQVFEQTDETGTSSVRFDEYDRIPVEDAILIIQRAQYQANNMTHPDPMMLTQSYGPDKTGPIPATIPAPYGYSTLSPTGTHAAAMQPPPYAVPTPPSVVGHHTFVSPPAAAGVPVAGIASLLGSLDVGTLTTLMSLIQTLLAQQANNNTTMRPLNTTTAGVDPNATVVALQQLIASLAESSAQQQQISQQQQLIQQLASQLTLNNNSAAGSSIARTLTALTAAAATAAGSSPFATQNNPPPSLGVPISPPPAASSSIPSSNEFLGKSRTLSRQMQQQQAVLGNNRHQGSSADHRSSSSSKKQ